MVRLRFSIVTPSFNQGGFIGRTIDSVLGQTGAFDLDYRVIDGGSTDGTLDVLRSYGPQLAWQSEGDSGQIDAINKGLRGTTGDIVGWVNSDDILLPGALARVAAAFAARPDVEWVHGRCRIIDENDRTIRRWVSAYKHYRCRHHSFANLLTENYVSQMTAFWRRRVHDEIGYLDPAFDLSFDYDLFLRLARRGDPIYLDDEIACFRMYGRSKSGAGFRAQLDQAVAIAARHGELSAWLRMRTQPRSLRSSIPIAPCASCARSSTARPTRVLRRPTATAMPSPTASAIVYSPTPPSSPIGGQTPTTPGVSLRHIATYSGSV